LSIDDKKQNKEIDSQFTHGESGWDEELWDENEWSEADWNAFTADDYVEEGVKKSRTRGFFLGFMSILLVLALVGTSLAVYPQLFSVASFNFIKDSVILSKQEEVKEYKKSVVIVKTEKGKGTGFFYSNDGLIVTNHHVIENGGKVNVLTNSGKAYGTTLIASDMKEDYALLKVDNMNEGVPVLKATKQRVIGEELYIIGNPLFNSFIVSNGIYLGEYEHSDSGKISLVIRGNFYKGNSGSPIINQNGQVIGILYATTKVIVDGQEYNAALAVPIEVVESALSDLEIHLK
jgi:serine protease Do